jgi:hypothetical protein
MSTVVAVRKWLFTTAGCTSGPKGLNADSLVETGFLCQTPPSHWDFNHNLSADGKQIEWRRVAESWVEEIRRRRKNNAS